MKHFLLIISFLSVLGFSGYSQFITVDTTISPQVLVADTLVSGCVSAFDINYVGNPQAIGYFSAAGTPFFSNITSGIIMASGAATNAIGPNNSGGITTALGTGSDPDLAQLVTSVLHDATVLTFNFIPSSDSLEFNYVFGSDEYIEYVNSSYNDVFAFFLTGPNPSGGNYFNENIALIPNTTTPVSINNVNHLVNTQYFYQNPTGTTNPVQYDGYTIGLSAKAAVTPCETYSIKLAVADAGDSSLDSGVFLEAGSFTDGTSVELSNINPTGTQNDLYEGCISYYVFTRSDTTDLSFPAIINLTFSGTATNGVDLTLFPSVITIPVGVVADTIEYTVFHEGLVEPTETFIISIMAGCFCNPSPTSDTITIYDYKEFKAGIINTDSMFCGLVPPPTYNIISTCVSHPAWFINYLWNTGSTDSIITVVPPVPGQHDIYWVEISDICGNSLIDSITVGVSNLAGLNVTKTDALCYAACNGTVNAVPIVIGPTPGKYFKWDGYANMPNTLNGTLNTLCYGYYTVTVTDTSFCEFQQSFNINQPQTALSTNSGILPADTIFCSDPGDLTFIASANIPQVTYSWNGAPATSSSQTYNINPGITTVFVDIRDYCGFKVSDTLHVYFSEVANSNINIQPTNCYNVCDGLVNIQPSNAIPPFEYYWSSENHGSWFSTTGNNNTLCADTFNVSLVDASGCTYNESFIIEQPDAFDPALSYITNIDTLFCGVTPPSILELETTTNISAVNYQWSTGSTNSFASITPILGNHTYTVTMTDNCGHTKIDHIQVVVSTLVNANLITTPANCYNSCDGSVLVNPVGGISPITYTWDAAGLGNPTQNSINSLCPGSYAVTITDDGGCFVPKTFTIIAPQALNLCQISNTQTAWCGIAAPTNINVNTSVNTTVAYEWSNGSTASGISFTPVTGANLVWVEFTDVCNNTYRDTVIFSISNFSGANTFTQAANCNGQCDGQITVAPLFGITPHSYEWSIPGVGTTSTQIVSNICAGVYQVTVSDAALCSVVKSFTILEPAAIDFSFISNDATSATNCNGFASAVGVSGGTAPYTYLWNNPAASTTYNVGNLCPGLYTVYVTDSKDCTVSDTIRILDKTIGIDDPNLFNQVQIFPNPSQNGIVTISNASQQTLQGIKLYDLNGRLIHDYATKVAPNASFELKELPAGVNLLYLEFDTKTYQYVKLIILD